jgi:hypothetical protein
MTVNIAVMFNPGGSLSEYAFVSVIISAGMLPVILTSGLVYSYDGFKPTRLGIVRKFTGMEIRGTVREKTFNRFRKYLLNTNNFSFRKRNQ